MRLRRLAVAEPITRGLDEVLSGGDLQSRRGGERRRGIGLLWTPNRRPPTTMRASASSRPRRSRSLLRANGTTARELVQHTHRAAGAPCSTSFASAAVPAADIATRSTATRSTRSIAAALVAVESWRPAHRSGTTCHGCILGDRLSAQAYRPASSCRRRWTSSRSSRRTALPEANPSADAECEIRVHLAVADGRVSASTDVATELWCGRAAS